LLPPPIFGTVDSGCCDRPVDYRRHQQRTESASLIHGLLFLQDCFVIGRVGVAWFGLCSGLAKCCLG